MSERGECRTFSSSKAKTENEIVLELLRNPDVSGGVLCLKARDIDCAVGNRVYLIRSASILQSSLNKFKAFEFPFGVVFDEITERALKFAMVTFGCADTV